MLTLSRLTVGSYEIEPKLHPNINTYAVHVPMNRNQGASFVKASDEASCGYEPKSSELHSVATVTTFSGEEKIKEVSISHNGGSSSITVPFGIIAYEDSATLAVIKIGVYCDGRTNEYTLNVYIDL